MNPQFQHDSTCCRFLKHRSTGVAGAADLYVCLDSPGSPTVIARFSDDAGDYISGLAHYNADEYIRAAADAAVEAGILKREGEDEFNRPRFVKA